MDDEGRREEVHHYGNQFIWVLLSAGIKANSSQILMYCGRDGERLVFLIDGMWGDLSQAS